MPLVVLTLVLALSTLLAPAARSGLLTQDPCPGRTEVDTWHTEDGHVLENLLFAAGSLWVSDSTAGVVRRYGPDRRPLAEVPGPSGGLALGPDGRIYAGVGNAVPGALLGTGASSVVAFAPGRPERVTTVASGFSMANGMTFGRDGTLYVSNDVNRGLLAIDVRTGRWRNLNDVWGANGLVVSPDGATLYAAITFDQRSPIVRVPLARPGDHEVAAVLSFGVADLSPALHADPDPTKPLVGVKGLDDMTRDASGTLYPVANATGELLRVDPRTGDACLVTDELSLASSVRIAPEGSTFADGDRRTVDFFVTEFTGRIVRVRWTPAHQPASGAVS